MTAAQKKATVQSTRRNYTILLPQEKYAIYRVTGELNSHSIRTLLAEALAARGWDTARIEREYLRYALKCQQSGEPNLFPGGRVRG